MYTTYIFDLDGTLLDTIDDLAASVNHALRLHGMPEHSRDDIRRFVGNGVRNLVIRSVPGGEENTAFEDVLAAFRAHYAEHNADHTRPYPGIVEMLTRLKTEGCSIAVVSNKFDAAVKSLCERFFPGLVDVAIGERRGIRRKPAPDSVCEAMTILKADPAGTVYIGDSDVDIATAANASLPCIAVTWGFRSKDFLVAHGAQTLADTPEEVMNGNPSTCALPRWFRCTTNFRAHEGRGTHV